MNEHAERSPAYLTFRVTAPAGPIAAFAEEEAWRARERYPDIMGMGLPVFHCTRERDHGGWEILRAAESSPDAARAVLAAALRESASHCRGRRRTKALAAAELLDRTSLKGPQDFLNELTVLDRRHRVVRTEQFVRMGPDGPEPPRPSDPDLDPARARPGEERPAPGRIRGFVIDPYTDTGLSDGLLRHDLALFQIAPGIAPENVYAEARAARETHPGAVLLPAEFAVAEHQDGRWRPHSSSYASPQQARDTLATHLRVLLPMMERLADDERALCERAADRLLAERGAEAAVPGRRYRITRVEQVVRVGPDGPEPPRPSDEDC